MTGTNRYRQIVEVMREAADEHAGSYVDAGDPPDVARGKALAQIRRFVRAILSGHPRMGAPGIRRRLFGR